MLLNWPTSEYKLEYKNLPTELRKKIWEENQKFRECCAENNRIQHFWYFPKEIGPKTGESSDSSDISTTFKTPQVSESDSPESNKNEVPESTQTECQVQLDSDKGRPEIPDATKKLKSALKNKQQTENYSIVPISCTSHKDIGIQTPRWESIMKRIHQSRPKKVLSEPCFSSNFIYDGASKHAYSPVSSIKSNVQEKKSPFLSYGWNDSNKDIGSKRTFNINASSEEVYPAALHALSRRREMHKQSEAMRRQRPSTAPLLSPVNHSSLWMTEYQDIFSRPQSAPFASKGVRWQ